MRMELKRDPDLIRRYLLGELDDERSRQFEESIFADKESFEMVLMTEDELIEDFVFGLLPPADKEKFVKHFLGEPGRLEKLKNTQALQQFARRSLVATDGPVPPASYRLKVAGTLIALIVVASLTGVWLIGRNSLAEEVGRLTRIDFHTTTNPTAADQVFELSSRRIRANQPPPTNGADTLHLSRDDERVVQLRIPSPADADQEYLAELRKADGQSLFAIDRLTTVSVPEGRVLVIRVPGRALQNGEYLLIVSSSKSDEPQNIDTYSFRVVRDQ